MKIKLLENDSLDSKYTFLIEGISNTLLRKLESFKKSESTIYPLEELKKEYSFSTRDTLRASKYIVTKNNLLEHEKNIKALEKLRVTLQIDLVNLTINIQDLIPDVYKRNITCEIDLKNLQIFITLRDLETSLEEEKELARLLFKALPKDDRNLLEEEKDSK
ncbi:MAG: hypothetical protein WBF48_12420 [Halarcobacter sp.]